MKSDIQISQEAHLLPIQDIAKNLNIDQDDIEFSGQIQSQI